MTLLLTKHCGRDSDFTITLSQTLQSPTKIVAVHPCHLWRHKLQDGLIFSDFKDFAELDVSIEL